MVVGGVVAAAVGGGATPAIAASVTARSGDTVAWAELARRAKAGELSKDRAQALTDDALAWQNDLSRVWKVPVGDFVEAARGLPALLCLDEIQTGVGRTGTFFAFEQLGVRPDLVTLAKGLANGLPIGALLVSDEAAGTFAPGDHGSTFGANPVSSAAACAVLEELDAALLENVQGQGAMLADGLAALPGVRQVRGRGLLLGALLDGSASEVVEACRAEGLLVLSAGDDVLRLAPPLTITSADVDEGLEILASVLGERS